MKKFILTLFGVLLYLSSFAQEDWLCVYPNKKVYFEDKYKYVLCIRIDSTFNGDTILYPFSDLREDYCFSMYLGSWLAKYIVLNEDGNTIFVNSEYQPILIKNRAALNETWDVFENEIIKVKGKITSISLESVLSVEDSVKTITFSVYDINDVPISHPLSQVSIEVSKHFGLVKTIGFYDFSPSEYNLIGVNEPQLGLWNINLQELYYDFQPGDEFHIWREYKQDILEPSIVYKTILRYLSRTDYEDRIEYLCERKVNSNTVIDTLHQVIEKGQPLFDTEPNEPYFSGGWLGQVSIINTPIVRAYFNVYPGSWNPSKSCFQTVLIDGDCFAGYSYFPTYYSGLGGPYWKYCIFAGEGTGYDLVYYKKGDVTWGTPFDFTGVIEHDESIALNVYPNPTGGELQVTSYELQVTGIEVFDLMGRKVLSQKAEGGRQNVEADNYPSLQSTTTLNLSHLPAGMYFVRITTEEGVVTKKVVKN